MADRFPLGYHRAEIKAQTLPAGWLASCHLQRRASSDGLIFLGIDFIDGFLTEINVTSPTGIRAIKALGGPDVAAMIWDCVEGKRRVGAK
jgi:glutathione synthase/RimK-type ligase-like ATP-grasp enzyme